MFLSILLESQPQDKMYECDLSGIFVFLDRATKCPTAM